MEIEQELFQRSRIDFDKLLPYGFKLEGKDYLYSKEIMNHMFRVDVRIAEDGQVQGSIYDLAFELEYTNYRIDSHLGEFVAKVKEEFCQVLKDIRLYCAMPVYFSSSQTNRVADLIKERYHDIPVFLWEKFPDYGVFRNPSTEKWYAVIMNIDKKKLSMGEDGEAFILNVKLDEKKISDLLTRAGFYKAYHMNKEKWISIILDESISDDELMAYIEESHQFTEQTNEWLLPANPKYYDIIHCFSDTDTIFWKQSNNIQIGDIVYLYVAAPYSAILYQCKVVDIDIPYDYHDKNISMEKVMKIQCLRTYDKDKFTFKKLQEFGIRMIRGPRRVSKALRIELNKK